MEVRLAQRCCSPVLRRQLRPRQRFLYTGAQLCSNKNLSMKTASSSEISVLNTFSKPQNSSSKTTYPFSRPATKEFSTASTSDSLAPARSWQVIEDTGEYVVSRADNAVEIRLTRPKNGNAMTISMLDGVTAVFQRLARDSTVFHIVLAAEGKYFCTGMDLSSTQSSDSAADSKSNNYSKLTGLMAAVEKAPQTTIAKIAGPCFGGGVGLAFCCDIRLVTSNVRFTLSEVKLGLSPAIISKYVIRELGIPFVREAMLTGREIHPSELRPTGAVHAIAEDANALEQTTNSYLDRLSQCAPGAASVCKDLVRAAWSDPGGDEQEEKIKKTFDEMMVPGSEGEYGISQFRKKIRRVNWKEFYAGQSAKL